jgi:hypothetical protein
VTDKQSSDSTVDIVTIIINSLTGVLLSD